MCAKLRAANVGPKTKVCWGNLHAPALPQHSAPISWNDPAKPKCAQAQHNPTRRTRNLIMLCWDGQPQSEDPCFQPTVALPKLLH
eukprot:2510574-Amphidinium_carterae.1